MLMEAVERIVASDGSVTVPAGDSESQIGRQAIPLLIYNLPGFGGRAIPRHAPRLSAAAVWPPTGAGLAGALHGVPVEHQVAPLRDPDPWAFAPHQVVCLQPTIPSVVSQLAGDRKSGSRTDVSAAAE